MAKPLSLFSTPLGPGIETTLGKEWAALNKLLQSTALTKFGESMTTSMQNQVCQSWMCRITLCKMQKLFFSSLYTEFLKLLWPYP